MFCESVSEMVTVWFGHLLVQYDSPYVLTFLYLFMYDFNNK